MIENEEEQERAPAFQFYCRDWLSSEKVHAMKDKAFRAYVNLLAQAWLSTPVGTLPDNDAMLASMSRVGRQGWKSVRNEVLSCFERRAERWASSKLCTQQRALVALSRSRAEAGRKGMAKRWKTSDNQNMDDNKSITTPITKHNSASASASASAIKTTDPGFLDNKNGAQRPESPFHHEADVTYCSSCQYPYEGGETYDTHRCARTLKKAGVL